MRTGSDQRPRPIALGNVESRRQGAGRRPFREQAQRGGPGKAGLAHPLGSGEQPGVVECAARHRRCKGGVRGLIAGGKLHGSKSASPASRAWVTSSGLALASISRNRSGSCAANRRKAAATSAWKAFSTRREPIGTRAVAYFRARAALLERHFEHEGAVGQQTARPEAVQREDGGIVDPTCDALIGAATVEESIANHPGSGAQCGPDPLLDMIGPGGREQQRLAMRAPAPHRTLHQQAANRLRALTAAGLARHQCLDPTRAQRLGKQPRLSRFAGALPALERDEATRHPPNSPFSPAHARPKKPASPTSLSATRGRRCSGMSGVVTTRSAICWPALIGALIGPS